MKIKDTIDSRSSDRMEPHIYGAQVFRPKSIGYA